MVKRLKFSVSGEKFYSFIIVVAIIILTAGAHAALTGTIPNPGHSVSDLELCDTEGEILKVSGGSWTCATDETGSGGSSLWTEDSDQDAGDFIYYTGSGGGALSLGTSSAPSGRLQVHVPNSPLGITENIFRLTDWNSGTSSTDGLELSLSDGVDAQLFNYESGNLSLGTNNLEGLSINNDGNVSIKNDIMINGDITVKGNNIKSGQQGTDSKRAVINLEVKEDATSNTCTWVDVSQECNPSTDIYPACDTGEFSGDIDSVQLDTCSDYDGTDQQSCEGVVEKITYHSCLDLQVE